MRIKILLSDFQMFYCYVFIYYFIIIIIIIFFAQSIPLTHHAPRQTHTSHPQPTTNPAKPTRSPLTHQIRSPPTHQIRSARSRAQRDHCKTHLELLTTASQIRSARSPPNTTPRSLLRSLGTTTKLIAREIGSPSGTTTKLHHREAHQARPWERSVSWATPVRERERIVRAERENFFFFIKQNR